MAENSFEGYIGLFIFYILLINYATFMSQILILGLIGSKRQLSLRKFHATLRESVLTIKLSCWCIRWRRLATKMNLILVLKQKGY